MYRLVISLLLLASVVVGQPAEKVERIRGFRGLNTRSNEFSLKPNDAIQAHNIDWSRALGSITKRYGHSSLGYIANCDSVVGLYGAYYSDGTQQMVYVVDSDSTKYGQVMLSAKGSITPDTVVWKYFSVQNRPSFAMLNDNVYIVNGDQKGVVINGEYNIARSFPIPAPGELLITPYNDTSNANYYLSGTYRYAYNAIVYYSGGSKVSIFSYISQPVSIPAGRALIRGCLRPAADTAYTDPDSMAVIILRTTGDVGALDYRDSLWHTSTGYKTIWVDTASGPTTYADTFTFIDSLPDNIIAPAYLGYSVQHMTTMAGMDSLGAYGGRRTGAPKFISRLDTVKYDAVNDTALDYGVYFGTPTHHDTLGVVYTCSFIDTITGIESDTGRSVFLFRDTVTGSQPRGYRIGLPRPPESDSGLMVNIYRGMIQTINYDSSYWKPKLISYTRQGRNGLEEIEFWVATWVQYMAVDTVIVPNYFLVGQVSGTDTIFADSVRYDSLSNLRVLRRTVPPPLLKGVFSYDGRLYGWRGSNLYFSLLDSANAWGAFDFIALNPSDGDEIVTAYPVRGVIRVHKNKSTYNVYQDASNLWNKSEVSGNYGCIAAQSHAAGPVHYFLSANNVLGESEGGTLERVYQSVKISAPIDNIDKLSMSARRNALGLLWNEHYILSIGDTSYVWDEKAQGWSTWSLPIAGYTYYGTESGTDFIPGDTLYFIKPGDSTIYRYGTSESDNESNIPILWKSGPLFIDDIDRYKQITTVGLATNSSDATNALYLLGYRHDDSLTFSSSFKTLTSRYQLNGVASKTGLTGYASNEGLYYNIALGANVTSTLGNTEIDGIDIWYTTGIRVTVQ